MLAVLRVTPIFRRKYAGFQPLPFCDRICHKCIKRVPYADPVSRYTEPVPHHRKTTIRGLKMASVALGRVSGTVLAVSARGGHFKAGHPRAGDSWLIETANVLVAGQNVTVVNLPRKDDLGVYEGLAAGRPDKGEIVDFLVEHSIYQQDVQTRVLSDWPADSEFLVA